MKRTSNRGKREKKSLQNFCKETNLLDNCRLKEQEEDGRVTI